MPNALDVDPPAGLQTGTGTRTEPPALRTWSLAVGDGHHLHVQEWGAVDGVPALVLHGGPGSGCTPVLRRFFDLARYRVICVDQRGAGRSTPSGALRHNTTAHLLADLRRLRQALGHPRWLVVGGSWGATLALAHALDDPLAPAGLLLRATFLARPRDIAGFFDGAPAVLAQGWPLLSEQVDAALDDALTRPPDPQALAIVRAWAQHEQQRAGAKAAPSDDAALAAMWPRYRIQSHYLRHGCWLQAPPLAERCAAAVATLKDVPTLLLHGTADRICPPDGALEVQRSLPHAALRWAEGAGHDPTHPAMVEAMVDALDTFADLGSFGGAGSAYR